MNISFRIRRKYAAAAYSINEISSIVFQLLLLFGPSYCVEFCHVIFCIVSINSVVCLLLLLLLLRNFYCLDIRIKNEIPFHSTKFLCCIHYHVYFLFCCWYLLVCGSAGRLTIKISLNVYCEENLCTKKLKSYLKLIHNIRNI